MEKNQDTLFSIQNEELKKERKYAILFVRFYFIFGVLSIITSTIAFIFLIFLPSDSIYTTALELSGLNIPILIILIPLLCILWRSMWFLKFWPYPVIFLFNLTLSIISKILHNNHPSTSLPMGIIILISAWRIHSFLQKQKKKLKAKEVQNTEDTYFIDHTPESFLKKSQNKE